MPKFHVTRTIEIHADPMQVFDRVADFGTWTTWSPWLCSEPDATVEVSEDPRSVGSTYRWTGEVVGAGEIEHLRLEEGKHIEEEIRFLAPMKSVSKVTFEFSPSANGTAISWSMDGALPWFLFWMTSQLETYIAMDYDRGLKMLKEWIETGQIQSRTQVHGMQPMGPFHVLGVKNSCSFDDIGTTMGVDFQKAKDLLCNHDLHPSGEGISVYHKMDPKKRTFDYTCGFIFGSLPEHFPNQLSSWSMPEMDSFRVDHTGSYDHLGNAWSAAMQHTQSQKLKHSKIGSFEIYKNDPESTPPEHLHTEVYVPIK